MEFYKVQSEEQITDELILLLIERYRQKEIPRLRKLHSYYLGNTAIKSRTMSDSSKPNNKIASPISNLIVNSIQGFFLGKPISYSTDDNNKDYMLKVQDIFDKNHEQTENSKLGKELSISGIAYELLYIDQNNQIKFTSLNPEEVFFVYDNSIEMNPLIAVRFYDVENFLEETVETHVEIYDSSLIKYFKVEEEALIQTGEEAHYFQELPIIRLDNNDENFGDYEKAIDLIDAYDKAISDTTNDLELFADSYLVLTGMSGTDSKDIAEMREKRVMLLDSEGSASWLTKNQANMQLEEHKNRLIESIHNMLSIPNFSDEKFGNATSGASLRYKLFGLETLCSIKERLLEQALEKRIKLITNILNIMGGNYVHTDIVMSFQRNLPTDWNTIADNVSKLQPLLSQRTLLSMIPVVDDPAFEIALKKKENEDTIYENYDFTQDEDTTVPVENLVI